MKLLASSFAALLAVSAPLSATPLSDLQDAYVAQEFGMFMHFNMGTFTGADWTDPNQPLDTFAPTALDTDQWAAAAANAGMTYAVLTAKHHDGYALWDSSQSDYDIARTTWYANEVAAGREGDIVKRYADSFRAAGLNVGIYYSIWDKHNGIMDGSLTSAQATAYVKAELTQLLTDYGHITCLWTDGWGWKVGVGYQDVDFDEVYAHIKTLSPNTLLVENTNLENNTDIRTWEQKLPSAGNTFPSEMSATIRADNKWFYDSNGGADILKDSTVLGNQRLAANQRAASFLLDVTPDTRGLIPDSQVTALAEIGAVLPVDPPPSTVLSLTENATGSSTPAFGSTLVGMVNDGFAYDPLSPTAPAPNRTVDGGLPSSFHGNEALGSDVTLNYTLSGGTHTTTALEPTIVIDVWGRGDRSEASAEGQRDNDFDILLLNGAAVVATVSGLAIDNDAVGDHARATFDSLAVGTQFDGARIIGHDTTTGEPNYFTVLEIRAASIGSPYGGWSDDFPGLTDPSPSADFDHGGLPTGIEWVTGGDPTDGADDASMAPTLDGLSDPAHLLFTFRRRYAAEADVRTTIVVEYGSDLQAWRNTADHGAADGVTIDDSTNLGGGFHEVTVAIPRALAVDGRLFVRLRVKIATP